MRLDVPGSSGSRHTRPEKIVLEQNGLTDTAPSRGHTPMPRTPTPSRHALQQMHQHRRKLSHSVSIVSLLTIPGREEMEFDERRGLMPGDRGGIGLKSPIPMRRR